MIVNFEEHTLDLLHFMKLSSANFYIFHALLEFSYFPLLFSKVTWASAILINIFILILLITFAQPILSLNFLIFISLIFYSIFFLVLIIIFIPYFFVLLIVHLFFFVLKTILLLFSHVLSSKRHAVLANHLRWEIYTNFQNQKFYWIVYSQHSYLLSLL